ncbi:MAG: hypothetical protein ACR2RB_18235 [Gammaproteobacteria bacterium]
MFDAIAGLICLYVLLAALTGTVYAMDVHGGARRFDRQSEPGSFWAMLLVYLVLAGVFYFYFGR